MVKSQSEGMSKVTSSNTKSSKKLGRKLKKDYKRDKSKTLSWNSVIKSQMRPEYQRSREMYVRVTFILNSRIQKKIAI